MARGLPIGRVLRVACVPLIPAMLIVIAVSPQWLVDIGVGDEASGWWRRAAFGTTGLRVLSLMLASGCGFVLIAMALARVSGRGRPDASCQRGTAMIEFALLFPVALTLFLIMIQAAFLYVGNFYVNLAAFRAARSAIVHIEAPRLPALDWDNGGPGDPAEGRAPTRVLVTPQMLDHAHRAAAFACIGISGTTTGIETEVNSPFDSDAQAGAQDAAWSAYIGQSQRWSGEKFRQRHSYALSQTRITRPLPGELLEPVYQFGHRTPIRIEVEHDFELMIPFANRLIGDSSYVNLNGYRFIRLRATQPMMMDKIMELTPPGIIPTALIEDPA